MLNDKLPLVILDMANSHMGSLEHGLRIIREFADVVSHYPMTFGIKLQYRHLDTFIHSEYKNRMDIKYVKRFIGTKLEDYEMRQLKNEIVKQGLLSVCTPFDEYSVDLLNEHQFDIVKVASCSCTDWSLLEKIVKLDKPIIASVGGANLTDIKNIVSFYGHRNKDFALLHCVAEYPTLPEHAELNQIDYLRKIFQNLVIGYSSHEPSDSYDIVNLVVAKGVGLFERHIGIPTDTYNLNAYSCSPKQLHGWLDVIVRSLQVCGQIDKRVIGDNKELKALSRGLFASKDIKFGDVLNSQNTTFAFPSISGQIVASDLSKYNKFVAKSDYKSNSPLLYSDFEVINEREKVYKIAREVNVVLAQSNIQIPNQVEIELSHHYGIDRFKEFGMAIFTVINTEYCKKLLVMLPHQIHPEQYHRLKTETFHILYGEALIALNGATHRYVQGDIIHVNIGVRHKITALDTGLVIEEISTTHYKADSYYTDTLINQNTNRKTGLTYWLKE